jgi:AcrR family transcriptional regulator
MRNTFQIERSPRISEIVSAARGLLEREGREGLTMRALGEALGIRAPSLYKHVRDKEEIEALLKADALREIGEVMRDVLDEPGLRRAKTKSLEALARAYRAWALANPHLYRLATQDELPRSQLPEGLEEWSAAPLAKIAGSQDRARAIWAFAHGMTILELDNRFPPSADVDSAWRTGVTLMSRRPGE